MVATRLSLTIGLAGVAMSLFLGVLLGGLSGLYGGAVDNVIQRLIEIVRSIPTIPLWMALAASVPADVAHRTRLFRDHAHPGRHRLDDAGPRGARALPLAAPGGFRHRR